MALIIVLCALLGSALAWFPPGYSAPWPQPNNTLCQQAYTPDDADLSGLTTYADGDGWIRLVEIDDRCDHGDELGAFGIDCDVVDAESGMKVLTFAAAVYTLSQQVWLPPSTVIQGQADPNVAGDPRRRPSLKRHTVFTPGDWSCAPTQRTSWARFPMYNSHMKCLRKGFLMNTNTALRNFLAQGSAEDGQGIGMGLSGGGLIELPGCGTAYASDAGCGGPDEQYDDVPDLSFPNRTFWTGFDGGTAVHNVLVENLRLNDLRADSSASSNVGFWSSMTTDGSAHTNVTLRKVVSMQTNQDGVNVHGSVKGWKASDLHFENTGDDVYAVWGAGADTKTSGMASGRCPHLTNAPATDVSFERVFARQQPGGGYGTCMSIFGARRVTVDRILCCEEKDDGDLQGMFNLEKDFCSAYPRGETAITVTHAQWFRGGHDLCRGGYTQFQNDVGGSLHGNSLSGGDCDDLCSTGCTWINGTQPGQE